MNLLARSEMRHIMGSGGGGGAAHAHDRQPAGAAALAASSSSRQRLGARAASARRAAVRDQGRHSPASEEAGEEGPVRAARAEVLLRFAP
jgi:hypothetical protein